MIEITSPALVVGLLIALTHGLLGIKVLKNGRKLNANSSEVPAQRPSV